MISYKIFRWCRIWRNSEKIFARSTLYYTKSARMRYLNPAARDAESQTILKLEIFFLAGSLNRQLGIFFRYHKFHLKLKIFFLYNNFHLKLKIFFFYYKFHLKLEIFFSYHKFHFETQNIFFLSRVSFENRNIFPVFSSQSIISKYFFWLKTIIFHDFGSWAIIFF